MQLTAYLEQQGIDEATFAARSGGAFSAEAVRKWRYGARLPRPEHIALISEMTAGAVTANDHMQAIADKAARPRRGGKGSGSSSPGEAAMAPAE